MVRIGNTLMVHLPIVRMRGKRYRARLRTCSMWAWWSRVEHFPEGQVYTWKRGLLMLTVMVDRG